MTQDPMRQRFKNIKVPGAQPEQVAPERQGRKGQMAERPAVQTPEPEVAAEEDRHRLTVYMPYSLYRQFKHHSFDAKKDMSEIVVDLVREYMENQSSE